MRNGPYIGTLHRQHVRKEQSTEYTQGQEYDGAVKGLSFKLQKQNSDVYHAYQINFSVTDEVITMRESVDNVCVEWHLEACSLVKKGDVK